MITKELLGLLDLIKAQAFCIHESTQVVVVCKNKKLLFVPLQVVAPSCKGFNNSQKLLVMSLVAGLDKNDFLREKSYWMLLTNFRRWVNWLIVEFVAHLIY